MADLCLTFDDRVVENWLNARSLFKEKNAKVTFCICKLHEMKSDQIAGLHTLQDDGHEIAFHSRTHPRLTQYLARHGLSHWIKDEVDRGIIEHRIAGFPAKSFAAPFHATTPELLTAMTQRFAVSRAAGPAVKTERYIPRRIARDGSNVVHNVATLDFALNPEHNWQSTSDFFKRASQMTGTATFTGHDIKPEFEGKGLYSTQKDIEMFLSLAVENGLGFRTLSQINPDYH